MKKAIGLFLVFLFILLASAPKTHAMGPINFYIRGGILTESDFSFSSVLGLAGANIDFNLGPVLMISPECDILLYNFSFNPVFITPGVLVNIRASSFFFGAGVNLPIIIGSGYSLEGDFLLKINAGFKTDFIKFQAFVLTPLENAFDFTIIGATFGFGF